MTQTSAALTITQAASNGGAAVTSVKVYYATSGSPTTSSPSQNFTDVSDNSYTVTGLTAGTAYTFKATSTNSAGESALSGEVTGTTQSATTVPDAPTIAASPTMTLTSAALTITQAANNGGATVTSVKVYYATGSPTTASPSQVFDDVSGSTYTVIGLTPGTAYKFKATSTNSAGESALSGEVTGTTVAVTAPGVPTFSALTMKKEAADATIAPSSETGGAAVTAVNLYYRIPPAEFPAKGSPSQTFTTLASDFIYTVTGLTTKTAYEFRATTSNSAGESDFSTPVNTGTTEGVPDAPTIATTTNANVGISTMDLTITQATDNGGQPVTAIKVYYRNASRPVSWGDAETRVFTPASDNEYQITGLKPDSMYQFRAVSVNSHGESAYSANQPTVTTASTAFPVLNNASDIQTTSVKINFIAVTYAVGYEVQHREGANGTWTTSPQFTGIEYVLSGLKPNTLYHVQVRSVYGDGIQSIWGPVAPQEVTTLALSALAPQSAPTNFEAVVSGIQVAIEWTPVPDSDAGTNATSIKNHELQGSRTTDFGPDEITGTDLTKWRPDLLDGDDELTAHSGLTPGHVWRYRIRAINDNDLGGPWSEIITVRIPGGGPAKPVLTTTVNSTTQITVTWTEPDSGAAAIIGYELQRAPKLNPLPQEFEDIQSGPARTRTDVSLMPSTAYSYRVRGINGLPSPHDEGVWSDVVVGTTQSLGGGVAPSAVRNLRGTSDGTKIILTWDAPSSGTPPYQYVIQEHDGTDFKTPGTTITARTYEFTGGTVGQVYRFRVRATNPDGSSPWAEASLGLGSRPDTPTALTATRTGTTINLTWTQGGTPPVTGYRIKFRVGAAATWTALEANTGNANKTYAHLETVPATRYRYRVAAINGNGTSAFSNVANVPSVVGPPVPGPVTSLSGVRSGTNIVLRWTAPSGTVTGYQIQVSEGDGALVWNTIVENKTVTVHTHPNTKPNTRYRYRVAARNNAGLGTYSEVVDLPVPTVPPAKVGDLTVGRSHPNIVLSWTAPAGSITGYKIEFAEGEGLWRVLSENTASQTTRYEHLNVRRDVRYRYRVSAINAVGTGPPSDAVASPIDLSAPSAPRDAVATREHPEIRLAWLRPADDGGLLIAGYRIEVAVDEEEYSVLAEKTPHNSFTHQPTDRAKRYRYRIYAINSQGTSPASPVAEAPPNVTAPTAPRDVRATITSENDILIQWVAPSDDGGAEITGYRVQYREVERSAWLTLLSNSAAPSLLSYTHENAEQGTEYEYRVAAINEEGVGDWSSTTNAVTDDTPGPPRLRGDGLEGEIKLEWDPPERTGGDPIISYRIDVSDDAGLSWVILAEVGEHVRGFVDKRLQPGTTRTYRIRARNGIGEGAYSNVVTVRTRVNPASRPRDLQASVVRQEVELTWLEPILDGGSEVTNYRIEISADSRRWSLVTTSATGLRYVVSGLPPDTERYFRVAAINEAGTGEWSEVVNAITEPTVPDPPTVITAISLSSTTISIAWNPPSFTGGKRTSLSGYKIEMHRGGEWAVILSDTRSLVTKYLHTGLEPGVEYHYRISAINRIGVSEPSNTVRARTHAVIPGPPEGLTVVAEGADRLRLQWDEPRYLGGAVIKGYQIEGNKDGVWEVLEPNTRSSRRDYLHVGLEPATTWRYRISAINEAGMGGPSLSAIGTTDPIVPDPPRGLRAEATGDQIELRWQPPDYSGGARLTGYRIEASRDRTTWDILVRNTNHTGTTYLHVDLPAASTWHYRVYAINEAGLSRASLQASATTDAVEPGAPEAVTATALDHRSVLLEWERPSFTGGTRILGYKIELSEDEGGRWEVLEYNTNDARTEFVHRGLEPATVYSYRVYAINRIGTGPVSAMTTVRTMADIPDPPTDLIAEAVAPDQIDLDWNPPENDGGAEVTGYRVEHTLHLEEGWEIVAVTERSEWSHRELIPGETHSYRVSAVNEAGISDPSNVAEATTDDTADRIERLNKTILPRFASTVASGVVRSISDRMDALAHNRTGFVQVAPLSVLGTGGIGAMAGGTSASRSFGSKLSAWGNADKTSMSSVARDMRWEGDVLSLYTGSDMEVAKHLFVGLSASHSTGRYGVTDYLWEETEGKYRVGMTSVTPYVGWTPSSNVTAWTSGSYSFGEIEVEEGPREIRTTNMTMQLGAAGLIGRLTSSEFGGLSLKVEGWAARLDVREAKDFNPVILDLRRVRTAIEWQRLNRMNGNHEFTLLANAGLRHDFNTEVTNHSGFEFGGGAGYTSPSRRMRVTATGRMLVTTDADYNEWGLGGGIFLEPLSRGGLTLRADPSYGAHQSGVEQLWSSGIRTLSNDRAFASPISIEYQIRGTKPYLRSDGNLVVVGTTLKGLSFELLGGEEPGLGLKGQWQFNF